MVPNDGVQHNAFVGNDTTPAIEGRGAGMRHNAPSRSIVIVSDEPDAGKEPTHARMLVDHVECLPAGGRQWRQRMRRRIALAAAVCLLPAPALATDGLLEINQTCAVQARLATRDLA